MASDRDYVDFVVEKIENAGHITFIKMFGEYGIPMVTGMILESDV